MKNFFYFSFALFTAFQAQAQDASVEKSVFNAQVGLLGLYANNEFKLTNSLALRTEIGLDAGIFGGSFYEKTGVVFVPVFSLEPRWYYNLEKRNNKGRNIANNSGNFVALAMDYHPDWFVISNYDNVGIRSQLSVIPKWGIRRTIGNSNFNYEAGIGLGYRFHLSQNVDEQQITGGAAVDLHLRIGYSFKKRK
jgi:hypothetical protein